MKRRAMTRRILSGDILLGLVGLAACGLVVVIGVRQYLNKPQVALASLEEMNAVRETTNSRLNFIEIIPGTSWIAGERPRAAYTITNKPGFNGTYLFEPHNYTIETGGMDRAAREFCGLFQALKTTRIESPLLESLREVEIEGSLSGGIFEGGVSSKLDLLVELLYSIRSLLDLRSPRIEVLIKGYADGEHKDWDRPLVAHYEYGNIDVLPPVNPNSLNPMLYKKASQHLQIPNPYKNRHLPDLRAEFVKRDLVEPMLHQCPSVSPTNVRLLKGYEFAKPGNPNLRRVEVQVNIF